ncbi:hypothetical protein XM38_020190 [Halomicronema hongdechloris C2206]|uniref:Uncharacterized protein n=1 Tax=Halomicronema hongdechloris C2206 TaxID=1641165 RepID=A0A1Z3HL69_9CYAN|nr:hypothetical protein [Halomicronema hongdechloris]ASC71069.1 hypothetical protein XM38_020190 [Halomicronema hongdechloris C2206]
MSHFEHYPVRAFIRHKAQVKLAQMLADEAEFDRNLLRDISATLLQPDVSPAVYEPCQSRSQAVAIEERTAAEIADTYCRIQRQLANPLVQQLNQLLKAG